MGFVVDLCGLEGSWKLRDARGAEGNVFILFQRYSQDQSAPQVPAGLGAYVIADIMIIVCCA